jgi:hypothetical protein
MHNRKLDLRWKWFWKKIHQDLAWIRDLHAFGMWWQCHSKTPVIR